MELEVYYYDKVETVDRFLASKSDRDSWGLVIDLDDHPICRGLIGFEHPENEQSYATVATRLDRESDPIVLGLFIHYLGGAYVRLRRILVSCRETGKERVCCFVHESKINVYDLGLEFQSTTRFFKLSAAGISSVDLRTLAYFYEPKDLPLPDWLQLPDRAAQEERPKRVAFFAHDHIYGTFTRPLIAIIRELGRRGVPHEVVALDYHAEGRLAAAGIAFTRLDDENVSVPDTDYCAISARVQRAEPVDLGDALINIGLNSALLPQLCANLIKWKRIADRRYSDVFFGPDGTPAAFSFTSMDGGRTATFSVIAAGLSEDYRTCPQFFCQHQFCYGLQAVRVLRKRFPDKAALPVGNSGLYRYRSAMVDSPQPKILIATSSMDENEEKWINALLQKISPNTAHIYLKPHPVHEQRYEKYAGCMNGHELLPASTLVDPYVGQASLVITDHSQVGFDAHLLGKPLISMCLELDPIYLKGVPSIVFCRDIPALIREVRRLLEAREEVKPDAQFIRDYNWGGDDKFYERVAAFVLADAEGRKAILARLAHEEARGE